MDGATRIKKGWKLKDLKHNEVFAFMPTFIVNGEDDKVETRFVDVEVSGKEYRFNFLDLWMFVYFCGNEEMRRTLSMREQRKVEMIPYEVTFKIRPEEKGQPTVKRRIELPVEDLQMYIATQEAFRNPLKNLYKKLAGQNKTSGPPGVIVK